MSAMRDKLVLMIEFKPKTAGYGSLAKPRPFLKWAGGKRSLLAEITPLIPVFKGRYIEPFLGAGAVFFSLPPTVPKMVNDFNHELIETYRAIRDFPDVLLDQLRLHVNTREHYLQVRGQDREHSFEMMGAADRAARFIFLNKACFNGLYRVNSKGQFNVPFGDQKNPDIVSESNIREVSKFLNSPSGVQLFSGDYRGLTSKAGPEDFVYLDPPYDPMTQTSSFVAYQSAGFSRSDQVDLRDEVLRLTNIGVPVLLSNSDTQFVRALYEDADVFEVKSVTAKRVISAKANSRGRVSEVLVSNYGHLQKELFF